MTLGVWMGNYGDDGAIHLEMGTLERSLWLKVLSSSLDVLISRVSWNTQLKLCNGKPGVCTKVSLFLCSKRASSIALNILEETNPQTTECLSTQLTKEAQPSRDGFVLGHRVLSHPTLSNKH